MSGAGSDNGRKRASREWWTLGLEPRCRRPVLSSAVAMAPRRVGGGGRGRAVPVWRRRGVGGAGGRGRVAWLWVLAVSVAVFGLAGFSGLEDVGAAGPLRPAAAAAQSLSCPVGLFAEQGGVRQDGGGEADVHILLPRRLCRQRCDVHQDDDGDDGRGGVVPGGVFVHMDGVRQEHHPQQGQELFVPRGQAPGDLFGDEGVCGEAELGADGDLFVPCGVHRCGLVVCQDAHPAGDAGVPVGLCAQRRQVLQDDHLDDTIHDHDHLFVCGRAPVGNELHSDHRRHHDHRVQVPVGLVAQRLDVLEDDHLDDTVHDHDHLYVPGGAPVRNRLHHHNHPAA